jgi:hypothetical protein
MHITPESPYCECYNVAYSVSASKQGQDLLLMDLIKYYKKNPAGLQTGGNYNQN